MEKRRRKTSDGKWVRRWGGKSAERGPAEREKKRGRGHEQSRPGHVGGRDALHLPLQGLNREGSSNPQTPEFYTLPLRCGPHEDR